MNSSKRTPSNPAAVKNLPEEIIAEILARLPVKPLLRFRCVSKPWLALISSPRFIKTHLQNSTNNFENLRMILSILKHYDDLQQCSVSSLLSQPLTVAHTMDFPHKDPLSDVVFVGYCNGLLCIKVDDDDVFLWNPSTRTSKKLPQARVEFEKRSLMFMACGFGFDESDDDYKVVALFGEFGDGGLGDKPVMIYSLKADSWKRVEDFKGDSLSGESFTFANGKVHFLASTESCLDFRLEIVSLDLESEVYGTVEQPNFGDGYYVSHLGVLGGCICVITNCRNAFSSDLWVLKDYGIRESWTKVVSIPFFNDPKGPFSATSLCMLPNGEILVVYRMHLAIYNPEGNYFRSVEISNVLGVVERANIYVESLVTL